MSISIETKQHFAFTTCSKPTVRHFSLIDCIVIVHSSSCVLNAHYHIRILCVLSCGVDDSYPFVKMGVTHSTDGSDPAGGQGGITDGAFVLHCNELYSDLSTTYHDSDPSCSFKVNSNPSI